MGRGVISTTIVRKRISLWDASSLNLDYLEHGEPGRAEEGRGEEQVQ